MFLITLTYINAIKNAGGVPLVIPMTTDETQLDAILNTITGLVMTGGEDVNPLKFYGEEPHPKMGEIAPARDDFDYILIKKAVEKQLQHQMQKFNQQQKIFQFMHQILLLPMMNLLAIH